MNILNTLEVRVAPVSVKRLGKYNPSASISKRPIRIVFPTNVIIPKIFRNAKKLKSNEQLKDLAISSDKTPFQLKTHKKAKDELHERLRNGETNIVLKYINGLPKIVSTSTKNMDSSSVLALDVTSQSDFQEN